MKPRIYKHGSNWVCAADMTSPGVGGNPKEAYEDWFTELREMMLWSMWGRMLNNTSIESPIQ